MCQSRKRRQLPWSCLEQYLKKHSQPVAQESIENHDFCLLVSVLETELTEVAVSETTLLVKVLCMLVLVEVPEEIEVVVISVPGDDCQKDVHMLRISSQTIRDAIGDLEFSYAAETSTSAGRSVGTYQRLWPQW